VASIRGYSPDPELMRGGTSLAVAEQTRGAHHARWLGTEGHKGLDGPRPLSQFDGSPAAGQRVPAARRRRLGSVGAGEFLGQLGWASADAGAAGPPSEIVADSACDASAAAISLDDGTEFSSDGCGWSRGSAPSWEERAVEEREAGCTLGSPARSRSRGGAAAQALSSCSTSA
jgi:hypothetical protein